MSNRFPGVFTTGLLVGMVLWLGITSEVTAMGRAAVPDAEAQAKPRKLVREIFADKYREADTPAKKAALAREMFEAATHDRQGSAGHYVLLHVASEVAAEAGDLETLLEAAERIAEAFEVNPLRTKAEALQAAARQAKFSSQHKAIAGQSYALLAAASQADDYETVDLLGQLALASARKARDYALVNKTTAALKKMAARQEAFAEYERVLAVLENNPAEPAANLAAGRYLCLVKGDWERGIAMLALGSDPQLKALAAAELRLPAGAEAELARGDGWWDLAQAAAEGDKPGWLQRADFWYRQAAGKLPPGLARTKVEKRLQELALLDLPKAQGTATAGRSPLGEEVVILKAIYGAAGKEKDVTEIVRKAFAADPFAPIQADDRKMSDPAPGQQKMLAVAYRHRRQVRSLQLSQTQAAVIPQLPGEGIKHRDADKQFAIVAARYGAGLTWLDVTPAVAELAKDPTKSFRCTIEQAGSDPWFGISKSVVVWFDFRGRRLVRVLPEGDCTLLP